LGLPSLLYMLLIHPLTVYVILGLPNGPDRPSLVVLYGRYLSSTEVLSGNGPLWFALALLVFSAIFASWRALRNARGVSLRTGSNSRAPGPMALFGLCCFLALTTFAVRLSQPLGTNVLNFQLCFFPQYIAAFALGIVANQGGWLEKLALSRRAQI